MTGGIGLGLGGILGLGIGLNAGAAGASIGGGATVSGFCASFLGYKVKNKFHYGKEEIALNKKYQEFKTEIAEIRRDYEKALFRTIKFTARINFKSTLSDVNP